MTSRLSALLAVLALTACTKPAPETVAEAAGPNTLTQAQRDSGWTLLFDGKSLDQWRGYQNDSAPVGWRVDSGAIIKDSSAEDIITRDSFGNFDLMIDWQLTQGGNAGIFYRGTEEYDHIYWSAPEYQLLDDANAPDGASRLTSAGAAYALYPSPAGHLNPLGQWNTARIIVRGDSVEHWLNGTLLLGYRLGSDDWAGKVKASKFGDWPNYGKAASGVIGVQGDHNGRLMLRNVKIRKLE
ncbi:MAG TPA: DUF1080 domain-containing protein [Gemmatimonadales bacterium]|nr:DUF1080 domain-containing protein [Gemmatimonadales bacterium]